MSAESPTWNTSKLREGDEEEWTALVRRTESKARRTARINHVLPDDVDDVTQDALLRTLQRMRRSAPNEVFNDNYLYQTVANSGRNHQRSRKGRWLTRRGPPLFEESDGDLVEENHAVTKNNVQRPTPEEIVVRDETAGELLSAVSKITPSFQLTVVLVLVHGFPYKEAAERQKIPIGTVQSRLHRARKQLQKQLVKT